MSQCRSEHRVLRVGTLALLLCLGFLSLKGQTFKEDLEALRERFRESPGLACDLTYKALSDEQGVLRRIEGEYARYGEDRFYTEFGERITYQNENLFFLKEGRQKVFIISRPERKVGNSLLKMPVDSLEGLADKVARLKDREGEKERVYEVDLKKAPTSRYRKMILHYDPELRFFTRVVFFPKDRKKDHHPAVKEKHTAPEPDVRIVLRVSEVDFTDEDPVPNGLSGKFLRRTENGWELKKAYADHRLIDRTRTTGTN